MDTTHHADVDAGAGEQQFMAGSTANVGEPEGNASQIHAILGRSEGGTRQQAWQIDHSDNFSFSRIVGSEGVCPPAIAIETSRSFFRFQKGILPVKSS